MEKILVEKVELDETLSQIMNRRSLEDCTFDNYFANYSLEELLDYEIDKDEAEIAMNNILNDDCIIINFQDLEQTCYYIYEYQVLDSNEDILETFENIADAEEYIENENDLKIKAVRIAAYEYKYSIQDIISKLNSELKFELNLRLEKIENKIEKLKE